MDKKSHSLWNKFLTKPWAYLVILAIPLALSLNIVLDWGAGMLFPLQMDDINISYNWYAQKTIDLVTILWVLSAFVLDFLIINRSINSGSSEKNIDRRVHFERLSKTQSLEIKRGGSYLFSLVILIGLVIHISFFLNLLNYGYSSAIETVDLLLGGPGPVLLLIYILLLLNCSFATFVLFGIYFGTPIMVLRAFLRISHPVKIPSAIVIFMISAAVRIIFVVLVQMLFYLSIPEYKNIFQFEKIISTLILGIMAFLTKG